MSGFIKESFIILVMVLYFDESFTDAKAVTGTIKCISINNQQCMVRPMLIDLDLDELHYYPFIISMSRCDGSCNTTENPFGGVCVPNKMEDLNLEVFNMIEEMNQKHLYLM